MWIIFVAWALSVAHTQNLLQGVAVVYSCSLCNYLIRKCTGVGNYRHYCNLHATAHDSTQESTKVHNLGWGWDWVFVRALQVCKINVWRIWKPLSIPLTWEINALCNITKLRIIRLGRWCEASHIRSYIISYFQYQKVTNILHLSCFYPAIGLYSKRNRFPRQSVTDWQQNVLLP